MKWTYQVFHKIMKLIGFLNTSVIINYLDILQYHCIICSQLMTLHLLIFMSQERESTDPNVSYSDTHIYLTNLLSAIYIYICT